MSDHCIMIVDDDVDIRESLSEILAEDGYAVVSAANGKEALERLRAGAKPCVILLDLMMPVMDGHAFREEQLRDPTFTGIPVVVVTAGNSTLAKKVQANAVLFKPVKVDTVLKTLRKYC